MVNLAIENSAVESNILTMVVQSTLRNSRRTISNRIRSKVQFCRFIFVRKRQKLLVSFVFISILALLAWLLVNHLISSNDSFVIGVLDNSKGSSSQLFDQDNSRQQEQPSLDVVLSQQQQQQQQQQPKRILYWTNYFHWNDFLFGMGQEPFVRAGCRVSNCVTTDDRTWLNQSDALLFHALNYDGKDIPTHRSSNQRYIFLFYEADISLRTLPIFHRPPSGFFNWTMSYRRDSDVHCRNPYGVFRRKTNLPHLIPKTLPASLNNADFISSSPTDRLIRHHTLFSAAIANRTKKVAWFVSKCDTVGQREAFFEQLAKYIPIDVYGQCGKTSCSSWDCDRILDKYKFYISAENSLCADYVTEKFYRALQSGVVPIVYGGADYSAYAPPQSFIDVADFNSPKALADYLLLLDENPGLYRRYMEWKSEWEIDRRPFDGWCDLCEMLNNIDQPSKSYENMEKWWFDKVPCLPGSSFMQRFNIQ